MANTSIVAGKRLLILDGSRLSFEIIDHARALGVETVVADWNDPSDSPAKLYADKHYNVSIADVPAIVSLIKRERIDGVITGYSDRWLPTYGRICRAAGLPSYGTNEQFELFTDKSRYLSLLGAHGVPTVRRFSKQDALEGRIPLADFPLIAKPADGSGARGIEICDSPESLDDVLRAAQAASRSGEVVIERYLPGYEATVHWVFADSVHHVAMVANRHMTDVPGTNKRLPVGYSAPSAIASKYLTDIAPKVRDALASVGVRDGVMFMQGLVTEGTFYTYDIGFRLTATQEYRVLDYYQDYNPLSMLISYALTGSMGEPALSGKVSAVNQGYSYNVSTLMMPGTIASITGVPSTDPQQGTLQSSPSYKVGDSLPESALGELRQIAHRTTGVAATRSETARQMHAISTQIRISDLQGKELSIPGPAAREVEESLQ